MDSLPDRFFHGSSEPFEPGFALEPRGDAYAAAWGATDFHDALERWRPPDRLAHRHAVFLTGSVDDVEIAGGSTEWCLEVAPEGPVSRHDLNWGSAVSRLVSEGRPADGPEVEAAARAYWAGMPHPDESVWEYLSPRAVVLRCGPYEAFDADPAPAPSP